MRMAPALLLSPAFPSQHACGRGRGAAKRRGCGRDSVAEALASMAGRSCVPWACGGLVVCVVGALRGTFRVRPSHLQGSQAAYLEHVCCMLLSLYCPVTCDPYRAVTLPNIGIPHRGTYPYSAPGHTHPLFKSPSDVYGWFGGVLHRARIVQ